MICSQWNLIFHPHHREFIMTLIQTLWDSIRGCCQQIYMCICDLEMWILPLVINCNEVTQGELTFLYMLFVEGLLLDQYNIFHILNLPLKCLVHFVCLCAFCVSLAFKSYCVHLKGVRLGQGDGLSCADGVSISSLTWPLLFLYFPLGSACLSLTF